MIWKFPLEKFILDKWSLNPSKKFNSFGKVYFEEYLFNSYKIEWFLWKSFSRTVVNQIFQKSLIPSKLFLDNLNHSWYNNLVMKHKILRKIFFIVEFLLIPFYLFYFYVLRTNVGMIILATIAASIWLAIWLL